MKKLIILFLVASFACTDATKELTNLWIQSYKLNCEGAGPQQCMQIQESGVIDPEAWQLFYDQIECFDYEEGFLYQVQVVKKSLPISEVPADGSTIEYKLVNIISKVEQNTIKLNSKWTLISINGEVVNTADLQSVPNIEFNLLDNAITGSDGCNRLNGSIKLLDNTRIEFTPFATTRMICPEMDVPDKFGILINETSSYTIEGSNLTFQNSSSQEILRFQRSN